jgi:hypothetical protein
VIQFRDALSKEDLILQRLRGFHAGRVKHLSETLKLNEREAGMLVFHLVPETSLSGRARFDGSDLKKHSEGMGPPGENGGSHRGRFNLDGWFVPDGRSDPSAYSQLYRDGRLEGLLAGICSADHQNRFLFDRKCEDGIVGAVGAYLLFCSKIGLTAPVWLLSTLLGCQGARIRINRQFGDPSERSVERAVAALPEFELTALNLEPSSTLRPWCDALWQSCGVERSSNYGENGARTS